MNGRVQTKEAKEALDSVTETAQNVMDVAADSGRNAMEMATEAGRNVMDAAAEAGARARSAAQYAGRQATIAAETAYDTGSDVAGMLESTLRQNPWASLVVALAAGYGLACLVKQTRR